jgi:hypothetical protein
MSVDLCSSQSSLKICRTTAVHQPSSAQALSTLHPNISHSITTTPLKSISNHFRNQNTTKIIQTMMSMKLKTLKSIIPPTASTASNSNRCLIASRQFTAILNRCSKIVTKIPKQTAVHLKSHQSHQTKLLQFLDFISSFLWLITLSDKTYFSPLSENKNLVKMIKVFLSLSLLCFVLINVCISAHIYFFV